MFAAPLYLVTLLIMIDNDIPFKFSVAPVSYDTAQVFYAHIRPRTELAKELLNDLYYSLWFPGYFGFNWDALYDCLRDFHWIDFKKIVIVHADLPKIPEKELRIYLDVLRDSVLDWNNNRSRELEIVFPESDRAAIAQLLSAGQADEEIVR